MAPKPRIYTGPVCYLDGWHHSVIIGPDGSETPGVRLVLNDNGTYQHAAEADESWHDRKHGQFATLDLGGE